MKWMQKHRKTIIRGLAVLMALLLIATVLASIIPW